MKLKLFAAFCVLAFAALACNLPSNGETTLSAGATPAITSSPVATSDSSNIQTATQAPAATAPAGPDWSKFADPGMPQFLPKELDKGIRYIEPVVNCADQPDQQMQGSCSTKQNQATTIDFNLKEQMAQVLTGDNITVTGAGFNPMYEDIVTAHQLYALVNLSCGELNLHEVAPDGHFQGLFSASWTPELLQQLVNFHLWAFLVGPNPIPTPQPSGPTPVANCDSKDACDMSRVTVGVCQAGVWTVHTGTYNDAWWGGNWSPDQK